MTKVYIASRVSEGNKVFPSKISISDNGVTLRIPGFFSGEEKTIPFKRIGAVEIRCPFIGYSSISIKSTGEGIIYANGFTKEEVTEMKKMILESVNSF